VQGDCAFGRGALYHLLRNRLYRGEVVHKGLAHPGEHQAIVDEALWTAVQAKLSENIQMGRRQRIETGALLTGLVFDERGKRMSPSYTVRRDNRYRYYIVQTALRRGNESGSRTCVGADDLEQLVVASLAGRGIAVAPEAFSGTWSSETRSGVRDTVERVVVHGSEIAIFLKNRTEDVPSDGAEDAESAENPNVLKANLPGPGPRARREIFLPGAGGSPARPVDQALVLALARARSWMAALRAGQYAETTAIAERFRLERCACAQAYSAGLSLPRPGRGHRGGPTTAQSHRQAAA
jgi:hypothetical protein